MLIEDSQNPSQRGTVEVDAEMLRRAIEQGL